MGSNSYAQLSMSDGLAVLTLSHPPGNEMPSPDFMDAAQIADLAADENTRALIIRGAGRHFSSGADLESLKKLAGNPSQLMESMNAGKQLLNTIESLEIPVIAEINGACFGGGLEIALACHFRICASPALFAFPEINHNLIPGLGGTARLARLLGHNRALSLLLTGDTIDSGKAFETGLVDMITDRDALKEHVLSFTRQLTGDKPKKVITYLMRAWHASIRLSFEKALEEETRLFCELARDEFQRRNEA